MRNYELMFIVHPDKAGDDYTAVVDKFKGILAELNCEMLQVEEWGEKKLAYPIKKQGRGSYVLFDFKGEAEVVAEIERRMRIDEAIIRFMTVVRDDKFVPTKQAATSVESTEEADDAEEAEE